MGRIYEYIFLKKKNKAMKHTLATQSQCQPRPMPQTMHPWHVALLGPPQMKVDVWN
jgi:hypothetical protein